MPPKGAKVLVDNCVPFAIVARLRAITSFEYTDAVAENIQAVTDNNLLTYADRLGFSVVLTTDQSMRFQQNMRGRKIGLVVLGTNDSDTLVQHAGTPPNAKGGRLGWFIRSLPSRDIRWRIHNPQIAVEMQAVVLVLLWIPTYLRPYISISTARS